MAAIAVFDRDTHTDIELLRAICEAVTIASGHDFSVEAPYGWGTSATLRVVTSLADRLPGEWLLDLAAQPNAPDALGDHDVTADGMPALHVFPLLEASPDDLGVTISHEVFEALADPEINAAIIAADGAEYALEVSDAVEATSFRVPVSSGTHVLVSNWVTPGWYTGVPPGRYDFMGLCTAPLQILPGGYISKRASDGSWTELTNGMRRPYRARLDALGVGRHARRARRPSRVSAR